MLFLRILPNILFVSANFSSFPVSEVLYMENKTIKTLKRDLKIAENQAVNKRRESLRERQARYKTKQLAEGKQRLALWVTRDDATLMRLVLAMSDRNKQKLTAYLQHITQISNK